MEPIRITSASNPIIREIRSLKDKKGRQAAGVLLLEGYRLVAEAADSGAEFRYFVVSDSYLDKAQPVMSRFPEISTIQVSDDLFSRIGETRSPQGFMAAAGLPSHDADLILPKLKHVVVLENLQDPGNLGTIIRTADACGFDAVILSADCVDPYNSKVIRSTMGSLFHLPVLVVGDVYQTIEELKSLKVSIAAAHTRNAKNCYDADLSGAIAIVIGNEGNGLTERMLELSDRTVMIPMPGKAESLNASAAASILIYESMRQRADAH